MNFIGNCLGDILEEALDLEVVGGHHQWNQHGHGIVVDVLQRSKINYQ